MYHLSAHCSTTKQCYGVLWPETLSAHSGNDIASGLVRMLENIIEDNPSVTEHCGVTLVSLRTGTKL